MIVAPSAACAAHRYEAPGLSACLKPTAYLVVDRPYTRTAQQHVQQRPRPQQVTRVALRIDEDLYDQRLRVRIPMKSPGRSEMMAPMDSDIMSARA
jgi:hypothetical protein